MKTFNVLKIAVLCTASAFSPVWAQTKPAVPQGPGTTMLVLDASGSMWGQIQGRPKIEIAREAVGTMLQSWPRNQQLGLMAYGHRSKGDCADIEVLRQPGVLDAPAVQKTVNALQPKGMTPISASVRMAAEQLKFTERKATVILVSDGEETCHADPCALGAELEKLGVDFTAHVVGFDLPKGKAREQLQCLAKSTGGMYVEARDAAELNKALGQIAKAAPVAEVKPSEDPKPPPPAPPAKATLNAPASAPMGSQVAVKWTGPGGKLDTIAIVQLVDGKPKVHSYGYVKDGNPLTLTMPGEPGAYTLEYRHHDQTAIATRPIQASPAQVVLKAPDVAEAGSAVTIEWTGPNANLDNIQIAKVGSDSYEAYTYLGDTQRVELTMPKQPGNYEFRYMFRDSEVIATRPIRVVAKP